MPRTPTPSRFVPLMLSFLLAAPVVAATSGPAHADVTVRVQGKVKVRVGSGPRRVRRVYAQPVTPPPPVRLRVGGGVYVHGHVHIGGFAEPPPPPPPPSCECDVGPVPAYYPEPIMPTQAMAPVVAVPAPYRLPRLGIGVFAGSINVDDRVTGEDLGVFGRLRLTDSVLLEAEVAQTQMDTARIDSRVGGALVYDLMPRNKWSAQLLAGAGVTHVDVQEGTWQSKQEYGELGAGLSLRLTPSLHLAADLRAGARARVEDAPSDVALKAVAPSADQEEKYTRGRLSAILYF